MLQWTHSLRTDFRFSDLENKVTGIAMGELEEIGKSNWEGDNYLVL